LRRPGTIPGANLAYAVAVVQSPPRPQSDEAAYLIALSSGLSSIDAAPRIAVVDRVIAEQADEAANVDARADDARKGVGAGDVARHGANEAADAAASKDLAIAPDPTVRE